MSDTHEHRWLRYPCRVLGRVNGMTRFIRTPHTRGPDRHYPCGQIFSLRDSEFDKAYRRI